MKKFAVIGDVYVDVHVNEDLVRLGGCFHAFRAMKALDLDYCALYTSPGYLQTQIDAQLDKLSPSSRFCFGKAPEWPGMILVRESTEAHDQGYLEILRDLKQFQLDRSGLINAIKAANPTDVLIFPGPWCKADIVNEISQLGYAVHIDAQYLDGVPAFSAELNEGALTTWFVSTSRSELWSTGKADPEVIRQLVAKTKSKQAIFKENRGGSQLIGASPVEAPAYSCPTVHSVGVGDVFDVVFLATEHLGYPTALRTASWTAAQYASTFNFEQFAKWTKALLSRAPDIAALKGVRLAWTTRAKMNVYLAAPDFPSVDCRPLDKLEEALRYHNFGTIRPIRDHGLDKPSMSERDRRSLFLKDKEAIETCDALIATVLQPDSGTIAELGYAKGVRRPTILFDPHSLEANLFTTHLPDERCKSVPEVVDRLFALVGGRS